METHNVIDSDIAFRNLQIATGLPGTEQLGVLRLHQQLESWVHLIQQKTERYSPQFQQNPEQFGSSWPQFQILCMVTVLQRDLGVHYDPESIQGDFDASDSRRLFIHGPLLGLGGTCVNLPVLYVAVGQRLGYPLKLVEAKEHLFVRWVGDDGEWFNIEATSQGYVSHPDAYYHEWPKPLSSEEVTSGQYLTELSSDREQACFLAQRGRCQLDNLDVTSAIVSLKRACELDRSHTGKLLVAQRMASILEQLSPEMAMNSASWTSLIGAATHAPENSWEAWATPIARRELERICKFARQQGRLAWNVPIRNRSDVSVTNHVAEHFI